MYPVASNFHNLSIQDAPKTRIRIYFIGDSVDCTDDADVVANGTLLVGKAGDTDSNGRIASSGVVFNEMFNPEKNVKLGSCVSSQISMTLMNFDGALNGYAFGRCKVYIDVYDAQNSTWLACPMGVYILEQPVKTRQRLISVTGYDQMQMLDADATVWWESIAWSAVTMLDIIESMATQLGVSVSSGTATAMQNTTITYNFRPFDATGFTYRQIIALIGEASGTIVRFDRDGALDLRWFATATVDGEQTYTGSMVSVPVPVATVETVTSLSVPITPTQNFNGYTKPWVGGAGKNLLQLTGRTAVTTGNILNTTPRDFSAPYAYIGITMNNYFDNANIASYSIADKSVSLTSAKKGYGIGLNVGVSPETTYTFSYKNKASSFAGVGYYDIDGNYLSYKQFTAGAWSFTTPANCVNLMVVLIPNANIDTLYDEPQLELGSLESSWVPYENICPISGLTGLSVYVSPTQDQQDATTYAEDWSGTAGTVYGGSIEVVSGTLKARPHYASYNGETLVGPWVSSMEEYAVGTTPTTGAEVVDLGGSETTYQLTPTQISLLTTVQNYLWASNGESIVLVVPSEKPLTIDTSIIGNQCLSIDVAEYEVAQYGILKYALGTQNATTTHSPSADNTYSITNNAFLNPSNPNTVVAYLSNILDQLYAVGAYYPIQAKLIMDWSVEAGDIIQIVNGGNTYTLPIYQQSMAWRGGYVVSDVMNDGDPIRPENANSVREENASDEKPIIYFQVPAAEIGQKSILDLQFFPGQSALIVLSLPSVSNRQDLIIVSCVPNGTITYKAIVGASSFTYEKYPYVFRIKHSNHVAIGGMRINFQ